MYKCAQRELKKLVALTITAAALCPWGTAWAADAPKPDITVEKDGDVVSNPWAYVDNVDKCLFLKKGGKDDSDDISLTVNNLYGSTYNIISGGYNSTDDEKNYSHKSVKFSAYGGVVKSIYGAYTKKGRVVGNSAEIYDGTVGADADDPFSSAFVAAGGYGTNGAEENKVTIMGASTINGIAVGGLAEENAADGNTVEMNFGGSDAGALIGGLCYNGNASGNRVTVSYGTIGGRSMPGNPYVGDNPFNIENVAVAGGMAKYKVMNNKVNIRDCKDETGVTGNIYGGYSVNDHAEKNTVQIRNSTINGNIYGGYSKGGNADQNTVQIQDSTITGNIYGGYAKVSASNNTVELIGNTTIAENSDHIYGGLYGGSKITGETDYKSNNNKLVLRLNNRIKVNKIADFQRYDLIAPIDDNAKERPYVHITGEDATVFNSGNIINVGVTNGAKLKPDDSIYLLQNNNGIEGATNIQTNLNALGTDFTEVKGTLSVEDGKYLKYTVSGDPKMSEASKSFAETSEAQIIMINSASNLIVTKGIVSAKAAAVNSSTEGTTTVTGETVPIVVKAVAFTPFAAFGGSNMRYETGSHVDSRGWGLNVGFSRIIKYKDSELTLAPLVEYGRSTYDSYVDTNSFIYTDGHGNGKNQYLGIGLAVKNEYKNGLYYDGSLRFGRMKGDYNGLDEYDTASNYIAAHVGIGRIYKLDEKHDIDCYGQFFYSHQNGDTVTFKRGGYVYDFDPVNSYKLRLGARWSQKIGKAESIYAGLAVDYEFDSSATAHYNGMATPSPSLKGLSGMLELGWKQEPTKDNRLGLDLNVNGWQGKQRGVNFNAGITWAF